MSHELFVPAQNAAPDTIEANNLNPAFDEERDSGTRQLLSGLTLFVTNKILKIYPNLSADQVSFLGSVLVVSGSMLTLLEDNPVLESFIPQNVQKQLTLLLPAVGYGLDGVDGTIARTLCYIKGVPHDKKHGQEVDVLNDRWQEIVGGYIRSVRAESKGDHIGRNFALLSSATATLPSLARAIAGEKGVKVKEDGIDVLSFFGSRIGRVILSTVATFMPEYKGIKIQRYADGLQTFANIYNFLIRLKSAAIEEPNLSSDAKVLAKYRKKYLLETAVLSTILTYGLYTFLETSRVKQ